MYTLRYSQKGSLLLKWDDGTFTDCRPCKADSMQDDINEMGEDLSLGLVTLKNVSDLKGKQRYIIPSCLKSGPPSVAGWPLDKANQKERRICQKALDHARKGYRDLKHTKTVH